jgi:diguanylate cyclase (GGDEF)-like protein/PAS domain S-box-containing protein
MQGEQALRESEEQLRAILESTVDGMLIVDDKGNTVHANAKFIQIWRIPDEILQTRDDQKMLDFVLDQLEDPQGFLTKVQELYASLDESFDILEFKDGRVLERFSRPLNVNGKSAGRVWSFRDVTERERANEALRESIERSDQLFRIVPSGIFTVNTNKVVTSVNDTALNIIGYTREDIVGKPCHTFCLSPCDETCGLFDEEIPKPIIGAEVTIRTSKGESRTITKNVELIRDAQGDTIGGIESFQDTTERKLTEEKLRLYSENLEDMAAERTKELAVAMYRLEQVNAIGDEVTLVSDMIESLKIVTQRIVDSLRFDVAAISLYDETEQAFTTTAIYPLDERLRTVEEKFNLNLSSLPYPYQPGVQPVLDQVMDGKTCKGFSLVDIATPMLPRPVAEGVQSLLGNLVWLVAPLLIENKVVGVLSVATNKSEITSEDQNVLELVSRQAGRAIENARYLQGLQERTDELEKALNELQAIRASLEQRVEERTAEILTQKQFFEALVLNSPIAVVSLDLEQKVVACNPAFEQLFGYMQDEILERYLDDVIVPEDDILLATSYTRKVSRGETIRGTTKRRKRDGSLVDVEIYGVPVIVQGTQIGVLALYQDISDRKLAEERLVHIATHDSLTDLPNRSLFYDRLNHALSLAQRNNNRLAILFIDLDGFKTVNDTFGHHFGDQVLAAVAERLKECGRKSDTIARMGGDEFTYLLENISGRKDPVRVADMILLVFSKPYIIGGISVSLSASIGISVFPDNGEGADRLLKRADAAMYRSKNLGGNNYQFDEVESGADMTHSE